MKNIHANIIVLTMWTFASIFWYWSYFPYKPLEITEPVKILNKNVKPGETIFAEFSFTKNTNVTPEIHLSMVDGVIYNIPNYSPVNKPGETKSKIVGVLEVPGSVPCGEYHLHWEADYRMNPIRHIIVEYQSEKFYVDSPLCASELKYESN